MISKLIGEWYQSANELSGGRLHILKHALTTFSVTNATQAAAALSYYAIFSLFPLLIIGIAAGSYFINSQQIYQDVTRLVYRVIPVSTQLIDENLQEVLEARGPVGLAGLITLFWSASGFFTNLAMNINKAWPKAARRNFLQSQLAGLGIIGGLSLLLVVSVVLDWVVKLAPLPQDWNASPPVESLWRLVSDLATWLMIFLIFLALYRWVPTSRVHWSATMWGAFIASLGWKVATAGFTWYLTSGLERYQVVYGSLGAIVALLFVIFLVTLITLFGAHLSAAIDLWKKNRMQEP